jgi:hypothetical protein
MSRVSFIDSPFTTKAEYERYVRGEIPLPSTGAEGAASAPAAAAASVGPRLDGLAAAVPEAGDKSQLESNLAQKLAIGHQEIDRIVDEVEQIFGSQPTEWLAIEPIGMMMLHEWYEDFDEFEDAVGGSFKEFLEALPQFETRFHPDTGKGEFKVLPPDPDAPPSVLTLHVTSRSDLWRVLHKSPAALVRIPHLEFEIGADSKRRIDSVYNHITSAVWNLSSLLRAQVNTRSACRVRRRTGGSRKHARTQSASAAHQAPTARATAPAGGQGRDRTGHQHLRDHRRARGAARR